MDSNKTAVNRHLNLLWVAATVTLLLIGVLSYFVWHQKSTTNEQISRINQRQSRQDSNSDSRTDSQLDASKLSELNVRSADTAKTSKNADNADSAKHADKSDIATNAINATNADTAKTSKNADNADSAKHADKSDIATNAINATNADKLNHRPASFYQNADNINAGTLGDDRLSSNVALQDAGNSFTGNNIFSGTTTITSLNVTGSTLGNASATTLSVSGATDLASLDVTGTTTTGDLTVSGSSQLGDTTVSDLTATNILQGGNQVCDSSRNCGYTGVGSGAGVASLNSQTGDLLLQGSGQIAVTNSSGTISLGIVSNSIGDNQLAYATGQNLTSQSDVNFKSLSLGSSSLAGNLVFTNGSGFSGTLQVASAVGHNTTYVLPAVSGSIVEICTSAGNCVPNGSNLGDMLVWDGTKWIVLPAGSEGNTLMFCGSVPSWNCGSTAGVTTTSASNVTFRSANIGGSVVSGSGTAPDGRGIAYGTSIYPSVGSGSTVASGSGVGSFSVTLNGLSASTVYYARAYAITGSIIAYGPQVSFTTGTLSAYAIGDTGPAGGKVFYDKGSYSDGWRYLEAAPADASNSADYGCSATTTGATGTAIGTGEANTQAILVACNSVTAAAYKATQYSLNGFTDWFLPSKDELAQMFNQRLVIGGFSPSSYWSSSESSSTSAWGQYFNSGNQGTYGKTFTYYVRSIRAF